MFATRWPPGRLTAALPMEAALFLVVLVGCESQPLGPQVEPPVETAEAVATPTLSLNADLASPAGWSDPFAHTLFMDIGDTDARDWVRDRWQTTASGSMASLKFSLGDQPDTQDGDRILLDALSLILSGATEDEGAPSGPKTDGVR